MAQPEEMSQQWSWTELQKMDAWYQLDWFVRLVRVSDVGILPFIEQQKLRQELAAMLLRAGNPMLPVPLDPLRYTRGESSVAEARTTPLPSITETQSIRNRIAGHITEI